jgi:hypothetical protein
MMRVVMAQVTAICHSAKKQSIQFAKASFASTPALLLFFI